MRIIGVFGLIAALILIVTHLALAVVRILVIYPIFFVAIWIYVGCSWVLTKIKRESIRLMNN